MALTPFDCRVPDPTRRQGWRVQRCRGPGGRWRCRWCGVEVTAPRRTLWCGQVCVDAYLIENDPARRRSIVYERDQGRCQLCGRGLARLQEWLNRARGQLSQWRRRRKFLGRRGLLGAQGQLHDCDHIRPRIEGGGHELANLRTLCVPCHKGETAALAARRARQRRNPLWASEDGT